MPRPACLEEFEILQSIYNKEVDIKTDLPNDESSVSMLLFPNTGDDKDTRFVKLTLEFSLSAKYPMDLPKITIHNPRGLVEEQLVYLKRKLESYSIRMLGTPVLFQLFDLAKDFLTMNNKPASECPICLMGFADTDVFYTPECYHHFHSLCLGKYLKSCLETMSQIASYYNSEPEVKLTFAEIEKKCPVCRADLKNPELDLEKLLAAPAPAEETLPQVPVPTPDRQELQALFDKQKSQGGIIDLTENVGRLLHISSPNPESVSSPPLFPNAEAWAPNRPNLRMVPKPPTAPSTTMESLLVNPGPGTKTHPFQSQVPHQHHHSRSDGHGSGHGFSRHGSASHFSRHQHQHHSKSDGSRHAPEVQHSQPTHQASCSGGRDDHHRQRPHSHRHGRAISGASSANGTSTNK